MLFRQWAQIAAITALGRTCRRLRRTSRRLQSLRRVLRRRGYNAISPGRFGRDAGGGSTCGHDPRRGVRGSSKPACGLGSRNPGGTVDVEIVNTIRSAARSAPACARTGRSAGARTSGRIRKVTMPSVPTRSISTRATVPGGALAWASATAPVIERVVVGLLQPGQVHQLRWYRRGCNARLVVIDFDAVTGPRSGAPR